jgi:hypothetical protein
VGSPVVRQSEKLPINKPRFASIRPVLWILFTSILLGGCTNDVEGESLQDDVIEEPSGAAESETLPFDEDSLFDLVLQAGNLSEQILDISLERNPTSDRFENRSVSPPKCSAAYALTSGGVGGLSSNLSYTWGAGGSQGSGSGRYWILVIQGTQTAPSEQEELILAAEGCSVFSYTEDVPTPFRGEEGRETYTFEVSHLDSPHPGFSWLGDHVVQSIDDEYLCIDASTYGSCLFDSTETGRSQIFFSANYALQLSIQSFYTFGPGGEGPRPEIPFTSSQLKELENALSELMLSY